MEEEKKTVAAEKAAATKETVKAEAKAAAKNVEEKVKAAAKKVVTKTAEKKEAAEKKAAEKPAKKTVVRKSAAAKKAPKTEVVLQYAGKEVLYADMIKKATQLSKKAIKKDLKDVKVYVKPEENMAYYVANNGEQIGSFQI